MGREEEISFSTHIAQSLDRISAREDIPLKLQDSLAERKRKEKLRRISIAICLISVTLNLIMFIIAMIFASFRYSPATYAFAADCGLDFSSSFIVIWRYFGSPYSVGSRDREIKACISLGVLFLFAGITVIAQGIYFLYIQETPKWYMVLMILAIVGCGACTIMGLAKYILSRKLNSEALFLDALNSFLSALFALVIIISDVVYWKYESIWYLDPVLSIMLSLGMVAFGINTLVVHCKLIGSKTDENQAADKSATTTTL